MAPRRNPAFPVGIDLYPLDTERCSPDDWYARDVAEDLKILGDARFSLARVFISWRYFEPQVGQYDDEAEDRLAALVEAAGSQHVRLLVCFFAEDQLGEPNAVPWGKKRDPHTDAYLIQRQVSLVQRIANRYRSDPVVFGWELANEEFVAGFQSPEDMEAWVRTLREALREVDEERPVTVSADPETLLHSTGVDPSAALDLCEFVTSHVTAPYQVYAAEGPLTYGPATYLPSFLLRSAQRDLPVIADGIGVFSLDNSLAEEAAYVRASLYSSVMNRAAGALLKRFRDVETERREPYHRDPYEVLVGIAGHDGAPKRSMAEVESFIETVGHLDLDRWSLAPERAAVLVPSERLDPLPSLAGLYDPRACLMAYISAKEAHLPVDVVREEEGFGSYLTLIVPSAGKLETGTWKRLRDFAQSGGALILSYGGGDADPAVRDVFGVEFLGDSGPRSGFSVRVAQPGVLGDVQSFDSVMEMPHFALLGQGRATVVATDEGGSPFLTVNQFGQGRAVFMAAPIERALAQGDPWVAPEPVTRLLRTVYESVAASAGAGGAITCDTPSAEVALFAGDEDAALLVLNHGTRKVVATVTLDRPVVSVSDLRGGVASEVEGYTFGVPLGPAGAAALRLSYTKTGADARDQDVADEEESG